MTEFYQPLGFKYVGFVAPRIELQSQPTQFFFNNQLLGNYGVKYARAHLDVGYQSRLIDVRLGPFAGWLEASPDFGVVDLTRYELFQAGVTGRVLVDQLDDTDFPRDGYLGLARVFSTQSGMGSEDQYTKADASLLVAKSLDRHTLSLGLSGGGTPSGDLPVYDPFTLGGFQRLSGLQIGQLTGTQYVLGRLAYYYKYDRLPPQLGTGLYLGASAEVGRMNGPNDPLLTNQYLGRVQRLLGRRHDHWSRLPGLRTFDDRVQLVLFSARAAVAGCWYDFDVARHIGHNRARHLICRFTKEVFVEARRAPPLLLLAAMLLLAGCSGMPWQCGQVRGASSKDDTAAPRAIRVGVAANYPPLSFREDGKLVGIEVDLAREVVRETGAHRDAQAAALGGADPGAPGGPDRRDHVGHVGDRGAREAGRLRRALSAHRADGADPRAGRAALGAAREPARSGTAHRRRRRDDRRAVRAHNAQAGGRGRLRR